MAAYDQFQISEGQEKYQEFLRLNTEASSNDPETEPYKSKYKAKEILFELKEHAEKYKNEGDGDERWFYFKSGLDYLLAINYMETEELSTGQDYLLKLIDVLEPYKLEERVCNLLQCAYNQLGILWTGRRQNDKV